MSTAARNSAVAALLLVAMVANASACGACDEDKIAATYDHATSQAAAASRKSVVYCAVSGTHDFKRVKQAARHVRGIQRDSVRVSAEPAALSFVVDPAVRSPSAAAMAVQASLGPNAKIAIVRVTGP